MTDLGRLHGHVVLGYEWFMEKVRDAGLEIKEEETKLLGHMILTHHGSIEREAVKVPMTQEAILLAAADNLDAELFHVNRFLEKSHEVWTQWDHLRNTMYYQNKLLRITPEKPKIRRKGKRIEKA